MAKTSVSRNKYFSRLPGVSQLKAVHMVLAAATLTLVWRFMRLVFRYAVDVLYYDQWDFATAIIHDFSYWDLFMCRFGPQRSGLGLVFTRLIVDTTHWNIRVEALFIASAIVLAMFGALYLKKRIWGRLAMSDVIVPLLFFQTSQLEIVFKSVLIGHVDLPLFLIVFYGLGWIRPPSMARHFFLALFHFVTLFTGLGYVNTPVFVWLLALEARQRWLKTREWRAWVPPLLSVFLVMVFVYFLLHGHDFFRAAETHRFPFPHRPLHNYLSFQFLTLANFCGLSPWPRFDGIPSAPKALSMGIGFIVWLALLFVAGQQSWILYKEPQGKLSKARELVILCGSTLFFLAVVSVGRAPHGLVWSSGSRYITMMIPGFLGLYFYSLGIKNRFVRLFLHGAFGTLLLVLSFPFFPNWQPVGLDTAKRKALWRECYLRAESASVCDQELNFHAYPRPEATHLDEKMAFLKKRKWSLYRDSASK